MLSFQLIQEMEFFDKYSATLTAFEIQIDEIIEYQIIHQKSTRYYYLI